jgi:homoserine kinase
MSTTQSDAKFQGWQAIVPATSANLGCAFDCAGLALRLYLKASFFPSATPELTVEYQGRHPGRVPTDKSNLVLHALQFAANSLGAPPPCGHIVLQNEIPVGAGLGSSAAAVVAGLMLGTGYSGASVPAEQLAGWANQIEGHLDNVAAAYCGGLVFAWNNGGHVTTLKTAFPGSLRLVLVVPDVMVRTSEARRVLPQSYSQSDVLHNLQRAAILAATCFSGRFDLSPGIFDDRLHQPYRQELVPGIAQCLQYRHERLRGIAISGSGPTIIAIAEHDEEQIARDLQAIFAAEGVQTETIITSADNQGAVITRQTAMASEFAGATHGAKP